MSETLARSLLAGKGLSHDARDPQLIETHISWVVLVGDYGYKIKKPVDMGFVDFSSLEKRRFYCAEEVRLNRRTAPEIYLGTVGFAGTEDEPHLTNGDDVFEFAVQMRRVESLETLGHYTQRQPPDTHLIRRLAQSVADFHLSLEAEEYQDDKTGAKGVLAQNEENFETLLADDSTSADRPLLNALYQWHERDRVRLAERFRQRGASGHVRECHGDLHLGNIFTDGTECTLFDCIEFSRDLRVIDTACDLAFLLMDLRHQHSDSAANLLLNEYLQLTGDYDCLDVMTYYLVYRALVRAKVETLRGGQSGDVDCTARCSEYIGLAHKLIQPDAPAVILMCGLSGTGKTTLGRELASEVGAIHLRSDVERKRLFGLAPTASSHDQGLDIYTRDASDRTFDRLATLAAQSLRAGFPVLVDATFIERSRRRLLTRLADERGLPWHIVQCTAPDDIVASRLSHRRGDASEAGIAQYREQAERFEAFDPEEHGRLHVVDTSLSRSVEEIAAPLRT